VATAHLRDARSPAQPRAIARAVAHDRVTSCRERDRVGPAGADRNLAVNAAASNGHGPRPPARQTRSRSADAIQVTMQGAAGGPGRGTRRRKPGNARGGQDETGREDAHITLDAVQPPPVASRRSALRVTRR